MRLFRSKKIFKIGQLQFFEICLYKIYSTSVFFLVVYLLACENAVVYYTYFNFFFINTRSLVIFFDFIYIFSLKISDRKRMG